MADTIEEVIESLEDIDLDETPPCQMHPRGVDRRCGKPSVVRILFSCTCGFKAARFICEEHYGETLRGNLSCRYCKAYVGEGLSWKVV